MKLPRQIARLLCLVSVSLAGCAGTDTAPEPGPTPAQNAPPVELDTADASGVPTAMTLEGLPEPVYATEEELNELYEGQITEENFEDFLDQIEAELEAESSGDPK